METNHPSPSTYAAASRAGGETTSTAPVQAGSPVGSPGQPGAPSAGQPDLLSKIGNAAPPWANGLAVVLAAAVAVFSVLNIDFGQIIGNRMANEATARTEQVTSQTAIITALNEAIQVQAVQIARLQVDNDALKAQVLELQFQLEGLRQGAMITLPTRTPPHLIVATPISTRAP